MPCISPYINTQAGTGSAATFQRLTNETQLTVQKIQSDVATKKSQVRGWSWVVLRMQGASLLRHARVR